MTFLTEWGQQYERMLRSYRRLAEYCGGDHGYDPDFGIDALIHFYEDAYHLKDWIKNDSGQPNVKGARAWKIVPQQARNAVESLFNDTVHMKLCADVANRSKHLTLRPKSDNHKGPRTGDVHTGVAGSVTYVHPGSAGGGDQPEPATYDWVITSKQQDFSALKLAGEIVAEWQAWLSAKGLP